MRLNRRTFFGFTLSSPFAAKAAVKEMAEGGLTKSFRLTPGVTMEGLKRHHVSDEYLSERDVGEDEKISKVHRMSSSETANYLRRNGLPEHRRVGLRRDIEKYIDSHFPFDPQVDVLRSINIPTRLKLTIENRVRKGEEEIIEQFSIRDRIDIWREFARKLGLPHL